MKAKFVRAAEHKLGIRFEPEIFEEQLLLESFAKYSSEKYTFKFNGWEHNNPGRALREGVTSVYGEVVREQCLAKEELATRVTQVLTKYGVHGVHGLHADLLAILEAS